MNKHYITDYKLVTSINQSINEAINTYRVEDEKREKEQKQRETDRVAKQTPAEREAESKSNADHLKNIIHKNETDHDNRHAIKAGRNPEDIHGRLYHEHDEQNGKDTLHSLNPHEGLHKDTHSRPYEVVYKEHAGKESELEDKFKGKFVHKSDVHKTLSDNSIAKNTHRLHMGKLYHAAGNKEDKHGKYNTVSTDVAGKESELEKKYSGKFVHRDAGQGAAPAKTGSWFQQLSRSAKERYKADHPHSKAE